VCSYDCYDRLPHRLGLSMCGLAILVMYSLLVVLENWYLEIQLHTFIEQTHTKHN
jgi:hypothetical protein